MSGEMGARRARPRAQASRPARASPGRSGGSGRRRCPSRTPPGRRTAPLPLEDAPGATPVSPVHACSMGPGDALHAPRAPCPVPPRSSRVTVGRFRSGSTSTGRRRSASRRSPGQRDDADDRHRRRSENAMIVPEQIRLLSGLRRHEPPSRSRRGPRGTPGAFPESPWASRSVASRTRRPSPPPTSRARSRGVRCGRPSCGSTSGRSSRRSSRDSAIIVRISARIAARSVGSAFVSPAACVWVEGSWPRSSGAPDTGSVVTFSK